MAKKTSQEVNYQELNYQPEINGKHLSFIFHTWHKYTAWERERAATKDKLRNCSVIAAVAATNYTPYNRPY